MQGKIPPLLLPSVFQMCASSSNAAATKKNLTFFHFAQMLFVRLFGPISANLPRPQSRQTVHQQELNAYKHADLLGSEIIVSLSFHCVVSGV